MLAQAARGIAGVTVTSDGTLAVDPDEMDPAQLPSPAIDGASHAGLLAFLAAATGRTAPVKVQLTGPVTLGLALIGGGAPPELAFAVAAGATRATAAALLSMVRARLPDALPVVFVDEPGFVSLGRGKPVITTSAATDLLSATLEVVDAAAVTGVHCCGAVDWRIARDAGADVLSLPVDRDAAADPAVIGRHLDAGGWLAWGAVPTSGPVGDELRLWRRLEAAWADLAAGGVDLQLLRARSLVTPACGLAFHGLSQAAGTMKLAVRLGERVAHAAGDHRGVGSA
jgi:hypothetical protein